MSVLRATTISNLAGTGPVTLTGQSAAKAWVNFNGSGTIAVRDSFNVTSLTDNATGNYRVNLTNSMAGTGTDYAALGGAGALSSGSLVCTAPSTASQVFVFAYVGSTSEDNPILQVDLQGDLA